MVGITRGMVERGAEWVGQYALEVGADVEGRDAWEDAASFLRAAFGEPERTHHYEEAA